MWLIMGQLVVVEDDPDILWALATILQAHGHEVRTASNGKEGLGLIHALKPDLIVSDIEMPIMTGPALADRLMVEDCGLEEIPILMVSGFPEISKLAAEVGTPYFLPKPFDIGELLNLVEKALLEKCAPVRNVAG